jgi:hypothetical protein
MMKLDFTAIRTEQNATEKPLGARSAALQKPSSKEAPVESEPALTGSQPATEGAGRLETLYNQEKAEHERNLSVYKQYQKNIRESGTLRSEIQKGAKAGEPLASLLLKAAKCISLMTGDTVFCSQLEKDLISVYGAGLLEPEPLKMELENVQNRLTSLQQAIERDTEPEESKDRLRRAVQVHKAREEQLIELIEKAQP